MYNKLKVRQKDGTMLKQFHHISIDAQFRQDCKVWLEFLRADDNSRLCRPFLDVNAFQYAETLKFSTDSSLNKDFGFGAVFNNSLTFGRWGSKFVIE